MTEWERVGSSSVDTSANELAANVTTFSTLAAFAKPASSDTTPPTLTNPGAFDLTDGDGSVADGDSVKLNVTVTDDSSVASVTANASAFGAGTVTLTDSDGDGVYDATFTVGSAGSIASDGVATITFAAVDVEGNTNTTTASLTIDTSTPTPTPTPTDGGETISPGQAGFGLGIALLALLGAALLALRRR
jgi:PGF-CTERM protein